MSDDSTLERSIRKVGEKLFNAMKGDIPSFFDRKKWSGRLMAWSMKEERFKVQLFHFIDVLPSLKSDDQVVRLLKEYFFGREELLPEAVKRWMPQKGFMASLAGKTIKMNVESLARQFIAARGNAHIFKPLKALRDDGRVFTIDLLGEAVLSDDEATVYGERYLDLLNRLYDVVKSWPDDELLDSNPLGRLPRVDISLKISSFYSRLDPVDDEGSREGVKRGLRSVFRRALEKDAAITFDMEHYPLKDITLAIFREMLDEFPSFHFAGIAIQTYLKETEKDLIDLIGWARQRGRVITVRLVKGAYWDYEKVLSRQLGWPVPVFETKSETDSAFERCTRLLMDNIDVVRPAIASHNVRSIAHAIAYADTLSLPRRAIEFQTLYGMAEPVKNAVAHMGYRVREYVPVGEFLPGMAYLVRRLLENTSNESFLRQSFVENVDVKLLLANPDSVVRTGEKEWSSSFDNSPLTDFSREEMRTRFSEALARVKGEMKSGGKIPCVIGSEKIVTEREIQSRNPASADEVVGVVSSASRSDAERAVVVACDAFDGWRRRPAEERASYLFEAARWIEARRFDIAALQLMEVGKNRREADADVAEAVDFLNYYGREMIRLSRPERLGDFPGELNEHSYLPRGVCVVISPWNFPLAIACGMAAAALVAGNCVILKPSSLSPLTAWKFMEAFEAAGLPEGVLQFLPGPGGEVGDLLVEHPRTDIIAFTGSMEVGLGIVERAGKTVAGQKNVKKVVAEMGGKNAIIVDSSADLDEAVKGVIDSWLGFQGQKCSACSRLLVMEDIHHDFLERLTKAVKSITIGPPEAPGNILGPVIDRGALEKIREYVEIGKRESTLHYLSDNLPEEGCFAPAALFSNVTPACRIAREEIFGPVLTVIKTKDMDDAITIANDTPYALTGGIFSRSPVNIDKAREEMMVGNLYINRKITGALVGRQPFGGFGMSGLGSKAGGRDYLLHFLTPRCVTENTLRRGFAPETGD